MDDVSVVDYHTAGEPFRIVTSVEILGASVADRRVTAQRSAAIDAVRQLLVNEPRGHADMYGGFVVPADDDGADFGVVFWHKDGYSTACGHGTIALATWAVDTGLVQGPEVTIDVPSGRVTARVDAARGVAFRNVPSYVLRRQVPVPTARGDVLVDISYGGAFYASVPASALGLSVTPACYTELIAAGRSIKWALDSSAVHPSDPRLSGLYGTILYDDLGDGADGPHQRNLAVFADGEADRSPCGSGTSARLALLHDEGRLRVGQTLRHDSIVGTTFLGRVVSQTPDGVITEVTGAAYRTGTATFSLDPRDPLGTGFTLR